MWYCWHGARILDQLRLVVYPNLFIGGLYIPGGLFGISEPSTVLFCLEICQISRRWEEFWGCCILWHGNGAMDTPFGVKSWRLNRGHTCLRQAIVNKHVQDPVWSPAEEPWKSQGGRMNLDQSFICSMLCITMITWLCWFVILEQKIIMMCSLMHDDSPFFPNQCETHVHLAWIIDNRSTVAVLNWESTLSSFLVHDFFNQIISTDLRCPWFPTKQTIDSDLNSWYVFRFIEVFCIYQVIQSHLKIGWWFVTLKKGFFVTSRGWFHGASAASRYQNLQV